MKAVAVVALLALFVVFEFAYNARLLPVVLDDYIYATFLDSERFLTQDIGTHVWQCDDDPYRSRPTFYGDLLCLRKKLEVVHRAVKRHAHSMCLGAQLAPRFVGAFYHIAMLAFAVVGSFVYAAWIACEIGVLLALYIGVALYTVLWPVLKVCCCISAHFIGTVVQLFAALLLLLLYATAMSACARLATYLTTEHIECADCICRRCWCLWVGDNLRRLYFVPIAALFKLHNKLASLCNALVSFLSGCFTLEVYCSANSEEMYFKIGTRAKK